MWWAIIGLVVSFGVLILLGERIYGGTCICDDSDHCTCGGAWGGRE